MNPSLCFMRSSPSFFAAIAACVIFTVPLLAQVAPATSPAPKEEAWFEMSVYRVSSTQDTGYTAYAATPFKTKQQLVDIPQAITVVTRDLIDDIGEIDLAKVLVYVGGVPKFGGELFQLRGSNAFSTYPVVDGLISRTVYMDNIFVDSIEIIRGPAALLYPNSQLSGVINKTTRRPQSKPMTSISTKVSDYGLYRVTADSTGPIGKVGAGQLNYRVLGGFSRGDAYFTNTKEDRTMFHPSFQFDFENTSVMVAYDYQEITRPSNPTGLVQPNGRIFTGVGRKGSALLPPGASETHTHNGVRANVVHQYSRSWESRLGLDWNEMHRVGSVVLPLAANWDTRTVSFFNRRNDLLLENASISFDTNGSYELAGMKHQTTLGLNITVQKATTKLWVNENFGGPATRFNVRPIDNPQVNTLPVLGVNAFTAPANPGNRVRSEFSNFYLQQSVEVIKDRLLVVGGYAKFKDETNNLANFLVNTATLARENANLYRFGVVAQFLDKKLVFYAMKANNQLPPSPTAILEDGTSVPGASGDGLEFGVKLRLLDGKLTATVSHFDLETNGLAVFGGVRPDGRSFNVLLGKTRSKGVDGEITYSVSNSFELIANFYSGDVKDVFNNRPVDDAYESTLGVVGKYTFRDGGAKGLSLGAGGYNTTGRVTSTGALTYAGKPAFITQDSDPVIKLFANYSLNQNWSFKLELENAFDGLSPLAINSATLIETNIGRSFSFQSVYKF